MLPKLLKIEIKIESNPNINIKLDTEVGPADTVLGMMSPYQKELLIVALQLQIAANKSSEAANGSDVNGMKSILEAKANELSVKSNTIMKAFLVDVAETYNLWGRYNEIDIGVRKDWMVVWNETEKEEKTIPYLIDVTNN